MSTPAPAEVTKLLLAWGAGDELALDQLLPVVYRELHSMARGYMAAERPDHTLQASALVNEVYLKRVDVRQMKWQNRAHFFGVSAQLMACAWWRWRGTANQWRCCAPNLMKAKRSFRPMAGGLPILPKNRAHQKFMSGHSLPRIRPKAQSG